MEVRKEKNEKAMLAAISGRIDTVTAPQLEAELRGEAEGINALTLDFSGVEYISSAGLRVLLSLQKSMNGRGKMTVKNVNEMIQEIFDMTGFTDILTIE